MQFMSLGLFAECWFFLLVSLMETLPGSSIWFASALFWFGSFVSIFSFHLFLYYVCHWWSSLFHFFISSIYSVCSVDFRCWIVVWVLHRLELRCYDVNVSEERFFMCPYSGCQPLLVSFWFGWLLLGFSLSGYLAASSVAGLMDTRRFCFLGIILDSFQLFSDKVLLNQLSWHICRFIALHTCNSDCLSVWFILLSPGWDYFFSWCLSFFSLQSICAPWASLAPSYWVSVET